MFDTGNMGDENIKLPKFESFIFRFLKRFFPKFTLFIFKFVHRKNSNSARQLHDIFSKSKRIDVIPSEGTGRAFTLLIDQQSALYFSQDGDKFVYDGWEAGKYEEVGDITVFDNHKKN
jgi:hypothetical protein